MLPTPEALEERRRGYRRRGVVSAAVLILMALSCLVPHLGVRAAEGEYGRSLFPASLFFLNATANAPAFTGTTNLDAVAAGLNVAYFGLSMQHLGLLGGVFTFWSIAAATLGVWTRRVLVASGWLFTLSAPTTVLAYQLLESGAVAARLGVAWIFALLAGVAMILGGRAARARVDSEWYFVRPDWNG